MNQANLATSSLGARWMREHEERALVLSELHARPSLPLSMPRRVYRFAFVTGDEEAKADRLSIAELADARGVAAPARDAKHHRFDLGDWDLRWEQHTEFTTYTWSSGSDAVEPFSRPNPFAAGEFTFGPPGRLLAAVHLSIIAGDRLDDRIMERFEPQSLCVIAAADGAARLSTDFQVDSDGFTRFLIESKCLTGTRAGRLAQRVLEIETYRTFALLGLPEARRASPHLRRMERELSEITQAISATHNTASNQALLNRLSDLAAELEAQTAGTAFRFGAGRAYHALVKSRLELIQERKEGDHVSITSFFRARLDPAIETCNAIESRQERLSSQLTRTADLLRTGSQFELEQQNRDLLQSMNRRAHLQFMLQQTVKGLSVAAISYYVVGFVGYLARGFKDAGLLPQSVSPDIATAAAVPLVVLCVLALTYRVRRSMDRAEAGDDQH